MPEFPTTPERRPTLPVQNAPARMSKKTAPLELRIPDAATLQRPRLFHPTFSGLTGAKP